LTHLIVTLGKERIPKGQEVKLTFGERKIGDRIEEVEEIYFTNTSDKEVRIDGANLSYYGTSREFVDRPTSIAPKAFYKTKAFVSSTSLYRGEHGRLLKLIVDGVPQQVEIHERRTPVSELGSGL
jgi:hypothetical protein